MKTICCAGLLTLAFIATAAGAKIPIVISDRAAPVERIAAEELSRYLPEVYSGHEFPVVVSQRGSGRSILLGTGDNTAAMRQHVAIKRFSSPESFVIKTTADGGVMLAGSSPRATMHAVYSLLEKLGYGFYLSYETRPAERKTIDFAEWELTDEPLFSERLVFNWHNFLSSASTWEIEDWQRYISQAAKMRYNGIIVHAYGNNPMFTYTFNGKQKPVGYLATTRSGRDWGTQHVNDVRRLIGGEVFRSPVFGSSVAQVSQAQRVETATDLMRQAFTYARDRGMSVTFALDVDTASANAPELIATLPEHARIRAGSVELANPETEEGFRFYRAQVSALVTAYPQITRLAVWFRREGTPWRNLRVEEFPAEWRKQYESALVRSPELRSDPHAHGMFAMSKLVEVYGRALRDVARRDIELAAGSWRLDFSGAADVFFPREVTLLPLDWETVFDAPRGLAELQRVRSGRKLVPIIWAHHDDRTYIGRPYTPYADLPRLLRDRRSAGFGIIHWTTRPLDLYFKVSSEQVWRLMSSRPLESSCEDMAVRTFGEAARKTGGAYLCDWVRTGRMFGRETTDTFVDVPLTDAEEVVAGCKRRLGMLQKVGVGTWVDYFADYERFTAEFFSSHAAFERAQGLARAGDYTGAAKALQQCRPEEAIGLYAKAAAQGTISRGEEAIIVSLNLRWLPFLRSVKQSLGLEPALVRFGATEHEPLAQGAGRNTFFLDETKRMWRVLGEKETGLPATDGGVRLTKALRLPLGGVMGHKLAPGLYSVEVTFQAQESAADLKVEGVAGSAAEDKAVIYETVGGTTFKRQLNISVAADPVTLVITPARNTPIVAAVTIEPLRR